MSPPVAVLQSGKMKESEMEAMVGACPEWTTGSETCRHISFLLVQFPHGSFSSHCVCF